jgi:hypothetical protein
MSDIIEVTDDVSVVEIVAGGPVGPPGEVGPEGPQGPPGTPGAGFAYVHDQGPASLTWVILHNLGGFPNVTAVDTAGTMIEGQVQYDSNNQITLTFSPAQSGKAYLS